MCFAATCAGWMSYSEILDWHSSLVACSKCGVFPRIAVMPRLCPDGFGVKLSVHLDMTGFGRSIHELGSSKDLLIIWCLRVNCGVLVLSWTKFRICCFGIRNFNIIQKLFKHFLNQSINLSINQSIYLSIYQSINLSINQSIYQSINLSIYQSINLSIYQSINLSIYQSINLSINQSIYQSIYLSIYLSISKFV